MPDADDDVVVDSTHGNADFTRVNTQSPVDLLTDSPFCSAPPAEPAPAVEPAVALDPAASM